MLHVALNRIAFAALLLASLILTLAMAGRAQAATFDVTRFDDPAPVICISGVSCSLREAVIAANGGAGGDIIMLPAGEYTLTIPGVDAASQMGDLDSTQNTTIQGPSARTTTIRQTIAERVLEIHAATTTLSGVTITGGNPGPTVTQGGGIIAQGGTGLSLLNSTLSGNALTGPNAAVVTGGGIYAAANTTNVSIVNSTVSGNTAGTDMNTGNGGGVFSNFANYTITNSTISGNIATGQSGGVGGGVAGGGTVNFLNTTLNGNSAPGSNGFGGNFSHVQPNVTFKNTIVSNGSANSSPNCFITGVANSAGYNLEDRNECQFTGTGDQINTNPLLGALADNGGGTDTHALPSNSPAVDRASPDCPPPATDQRGVSRPQLIRCDVGAFEFAPATQTGGGGNAGGGHGGGGGGGGPGPQVTGTGGGGGDGGPCGGGGAGAGGVGAGGGGHGGGGCFSIPAGQRIAAGAVVAMVKVGRSGSTVRGDVLVDSRAMKAGAAKLQLIGSTTKRGVAAGTYRLVIRFTAKAKKQLKRLRRVKLTLRLRLIPPTGHAVSTTRTVTLKR